MVVCMPPEQPSTGLNGSGCWMIRLELNAFEAGPAINRGLAFVPALAGLGSPHWDDSAAGLFIGMTVARRAGTCSRP
jgi:sugar (pentulose or hexulose) kinase